MGLTFDIRELPDAAVGLRLCKVTPKYDIVHCEQVLFKRGHKAVQTVFRRAAISGTVGPIGETCPPDARNGYWADLLDDEGCWFDTVALDRKSWNAMKNHWMRCRVASYDLATPKADK